MKKIFGFLLTLILTLSSLWLSVSAKPLDGESKYVKDLQEVEKNYFLGGGTVYKTAAKTYYGGYLDPSSKYHSLNPQTFQWVDIPVTSEDVRIVTWSKGTTDGFHSSTTTATARDYEATHPGWIVVAAGNGDWFRINDTCEAVNLMVQDGEVIRPITINSDWQQVLGWTDDNRLVTGIPTLDSKMSVHIYPDKANYDGANKTELSKLTIEGYNCNPSETGITLYTKDAIDTFDLTGYTVYVGKYDLCRSSYGDRRPFVKGTILSKVDNLGANSRPQAERDNQVVREFYLVSKDGSLDDKLSINNYVKCQFDLTGEWANVTSACGYVNQILKDYKPMWGESCDTYGQYDEKTAIKPRLVIGFKEDGSTVVMDIDGRDVPSGRTGLSCFEAGELMRLAGCKTAYNLDGGGSATLIVKNEYNDFDIVNVPSDGSERHIGNAILFVMRDPGISWDVKNTTRNSASFVLNETATTAKITEASVTIDGKTVSMQDGVATIEGLQEDTEYVATVNYKTPSYKDESKIVNGSFKVKIKTKAFEMPSLGIVFEDISKTSVRVVKRQSDTSSWFRDIVIHMNDGEYVMGSNDELLIEDLPENTKFDVEITFNCVEPTTGNVYPGKIKKTVTTLSYNVPTISKFIKTQEKNNRVTIEYKYVDDDELVMSAVLKVNDEDIPLTTKTGIQTIKDLDLEHQEYKIQLVVTYVVGTTAKNVKSEIITVGTNNPIISHNITYNLDGGTNNELNPSSYVEGEEVILKEATKEGYKFIGWYIGETKVTSISPEAKEDIELTAKWEKIKEKYQITYILNGGTNNASNPSTYEEGEKVILKEATKEGYKFLGWYKDGELVTEVKEGNVTVEARFEEIKNQDSEKKGCNCKKTIEMVITLTSAVTLLAFVLRKKH